MFGKKQKQSVFLEDLSDLEHKFLDVLFSSVPTKYHSDISVNRMSNKCLNFEYKGMQFGRIKLKGKDHWMQLLTGLTEVTSIKGEPDYFIAAIPIWVTYIQKELL